MTKDGGFLLPEVIDPPRLCLTINIPNDQNHIAAFWGSLQVLAYWFSWQRDPAKKGVQASSVWMDIIQEAHDKFLSENPCEVDMSCLDVANCILTDEAVQNAIAAAIANSDAIRRAIEIAPGLGAPMGPAQLNAPINDDTSCDLDVVFAQITGIVDQLDTNNRDFLEIMAVASTPGKRLAQVIAAIPALETLPVDDMVAYVAKLYDEIVANYNAAWTTAVRDEYRCDLFCIARENENCELTYDDVFNYFNERLGNAVSVENLVASVVQYTILGTWSGTVVIDIMMLNQIAIWRAAGNWLGLNLRSLQAVTQLSGNIPDSDWMTLCTECPPPPSDLWIRLYPYGNVIQNSGPTDGSNGHYGFSFTSGQKPPPSNEWWSWWVWADKTKKFTITSLSFTPTPSPENGTFGSYIPGNGATVETPLDGVTFTQPVVGGTYGGFWFATFESAGPNSWTVEFDLTDI